MKTCSQPGCDNKHSAKGLCGFHYARLRHGVPLDAPKGKPRGRGKGITCQIAKARKARRVATVANNKRKGILCSHIGCAEPVETKGYCAFHYQRHRAGVDMDAPVQSNGRNGIPAKKCAHKGCHRRPVHIKRGGKYCGLHQRRIDMNLPMDGPQTCAHPPCNNGVRIKDGLCHFHKMRQRNGKPLDDPIRTGLNGIIYKMTCIPTGLRRVGLTTTSLEKRKRDYQNQANAGEQTVIGDAIRKHGIDAFDMIPIMVGISSVKALNACEDAFVSLLDTMWPNGYNMKRGGGFGLQSRRTCKMKGCDGKHKGLGYCMKHYTNLRNHGNPVGKRVRPPKYCDVDGCDNFARYKNQAYCVKHESAFRKYGDPLGKHEPQYKTLCRIDGCGRPKMAKGLCSCHYMREWKHGDPLYGGDLPPYNPKQCLTDGCERPVQGRGMCRGCYQRWSLETPPHLRKRKEKAVCKKDGCEQQVHGRGMCGNHYNRWLNNQRRFNKRKRMLSV